MYNVKIYGAGSIGNHLAYACRSKGWNVLMCDRDPEALERTKTQIYPTRYGQWDEEIRLVPISGLQDETFDLIIIGTPPDTHIELALGILKKESPRALLIEKPLGTPSLQGCQELFDLATSTNTFVGVGYNHTLTQNTQLAAEMLQSGFLGEPLTISAKFREYWGGIFTAHPWLNGPQDSYLGFSERGGGASGEHSHAINIWQHFASVLDLGRIVEVSSLLDMVDDGQVNYDRICQLHVKTDKGLVGEIVQDVITEPAQKYLRVQGRDGFLEWFVNRDKQNDAVYFWDGKQDIQEKMLPKRRPDDFKWEINHLETILNGTSSHTSPISLERGLETMMVVAAAHISHQLKRTVTINYETGYRREAIG